MRSSSYKKRMARRRKISISLAVLLVIALGFGVKKILNKQKLKSFVNENYSNEIKPMEAKKNIGKTKSEIDFNKNRLISVHYPELGSKEIDSKTKELVDKYVENFKEESKDLKIEKLEDMKHFNIDYEAYENGDLASIKFLINRGQDSQSIDTKVYSLKDKKEISFDDLFFEDSLKYLSSEAQNFINQENKMAELEANQEFLTALKEDKNKYSKFILNGDSLEFYLPEISKKDCLVIDSNNFEMYTKYDIASFNFLSKDVLEEKAQIAKLGTKVRPGLDPNKPMIALTYDDGPTSKASLPILEALKENNGAATFFVLGEKAKENPKVLAAIAEGGHEIGNHSYSHKQLTKLSKEELDKEVQSTQDLIKEVTGIEPRLLRPTYGAINESVETNVPMPLILWSIDTLDWKYRNADRVANEILSKAKDGDIVLMHDLYESTKDASLRVIPELTKKGFQLVTVSEMYALKGIELENGKRYIRINN